LPAKNLSIPKETFEQTFVEFLESVTPSHRYEKLFKTVVMDIWQNNYKRFDEDNTGLGRKWPDWKPAPKDF